MHNSLMPILAVLFVCLLIARFAIARQQKRRKKMRALHRLVAVRYQGSLEYKGDREDFEEAIKEARRVFAERAPVISALDQYRDRMVEGSADASHQLGVAIQAMARELKMDPATVSLHLD